MATCSFKTKLALSLTAAFSFFALVFSVGGITLAAYLNAIEAEYSNKIGFRDLGQYFNGVSTDSNTGKTTYQISNADEFRNLQMLVSLGLFDEDDIFNLTSDITWSGTAMAPIGSDDMPFNSTFNGCGHTISNLQIACSDGRDAGLFGYTSINSEVKNLILASPTITINANSNGGNEVSGSPIEAVLSTAAKGMPEIVFSNPGQEVTGSINVINDSDKSQSTIKGFPPTVQDINGNSYEVIYESSDENLIKAQGDGSFLTFKTETAAPNYDLFACTITSKVKYLIDDRFGYYVLERYQFNVLGNGLVTTTTDQDGNHMGAFKTIHPSNNEHKTYAGFFIGHCDGKANHLGLVGDDEQGNFKAKLVINEGSRKYIYSSRVLIGMTRSDNPIDASAGESMSITYDFDSPITEANVTNGPTGEMWVKDIESGYANASYAYGSNYLTNEDPYDTGNDKDVNHQWENAELLTKPYIPNTTIREYSKIFPGSKPSAAEGPSGTKQATNYFANVKLPESDETTNKSSFFGLVLDGGLGAGTMTQVVHKGGLLNSYRRWVRGIYANNGIWLWSTKNLSPLFGENLFYINIRISYVATRTGGNEGQNSFQILANAYNPEVISGENEELTGSYAQNLFWQDLHSPYNYHLQKQDSMYDPTNYPIIDDGKLHSAVITLKIDQDNNNFLGSIFQSWFGNENSEIRYPMLAIGMGSNQNPDSINDSTMRYYADIYEEENLVGDSHFLTYESNKFGSNGNEDIGNYLYAASLIDVGLATYGYQTFQRNGDDTFLGLPNLSQRYRDHERGYFNSYFTVENGTKLYIKDFQMTFTNRQGNTEDIIYDVDYINSRDLPIFEANAYSYWPSSSNVLVAFDIDGSQGNEAVSFSFYRNANGTIFGNSSNTNAGYGLTNSGGTGYTDATLTQG